MATSEVSIANLALSLLGDDPIISLTEDVPRARAMNVWYTHVRDAVLADHLWNEVSTRAQLSLESTSPTFGFDNQFLLPSNFLRLVMFNDGKQPFRLESGFLLTNADTARIRYIRKETDPTKFGPLLVEAIATRLAHATCIQITGDKELKDQLWSDYLQKLQSGRGVDAQQGPVEILEADDWIDARIAHNPDEALFRPIEDA